MRYKIISIWVSLLFVGLFLNVPVSEATKVENFAISIVKYKLIDNQQIGTQLPVDGTKAEKVTDSSGKELSPLAGVTYEITRVSPVEGTTSFEPVKGIDAFTTRITTNEQGLARVSGLSQGTYRVTEQPNEQLKDNMDPVVLELPLPRPSGSALNEVFLYPKSSVITNNASGQADHSNRLPQTSGYIGTYLSLMLILLFLAAMGILGMELMKKRKHQY